MAKELERTTLYGIIDKQTGKLQSVITHNPNVAAWKSLTKQMLEHFTLPQIWGWLEECIIETSDKQWKEKLWLKDKKFPKKNFNYKTKSVIKLDLKRATIKKQINDNLKITDVAKQYGIIIKGNKSICPFHDDKTPSLSFSNKLNVFNCFGCKAKGDVVGFIRRMEKIKKEDDDDYKKRSRIKSP